MDIDTALTGTTVDLTALNLGMVSLMTLLTTLIIFLVCLVLIRVVIKLLNRALQKTPLDAQLKKYAVGSVKVVLWTISILIAADQLGIPMSSLIALLSVASLAISLAVKDVLANVAGGLIILMSKPFKLGDYIGTANGDGTVRDIRLTYCCLDTADGLRVVVPNSLLSAGRITNYTAIGRRRIEHKVTASYDAAIADVRAALLEAADMTAGAEKDAAAAVSAYGESSVEYVLHVWCAPANYWSVYYALLENIKSRFDAHGIEMTYNHLNVHIVDKA